ncbi:MAG: xanthine dehydrogenase small subunit [Devosia sp. 67-54]|uniref:xanthine dehydrogenase small subunit n=1 Tax=unclassified Devosia TaxID=196773 RepID=UPI000968C8C3|nr:MULTISPECIES: xanthine dehydrogenase small subunit [unclassified Devosia]MBN9303611.1 xanthine dehydrogenase small subunit [Devosia sp.]OJX17502.1 MAG: xanthine dehydrogenase small subunit [Devosia sp. 67-54]
MSGATNMLRFILNDEEIAISEIRATETLLDYLRLTRRLRGSKEGCAEGDCGACTVLVGRLRGGELSYETVNACICFVGMLHGTHVVTIEHLSPASGPLHPVQQAMVDFHGSQCGFCTPGIVMSLYGLWMQTPRPSVPEIEVALQGNLCRCTGYQPIVKAGLAMSQYGAVEADPLLLHRTQMVARLEALRDGRTVDIGEGRNRLIVPASVDDLAEIYAANPGGTLVSGATDVGLWVTKFMRDIGPMIYIGHLPELQTITETEGALTLGAGITYTQARVAVVKHFPQLAELWDRIGGGQVRNAGTVGANIANGSPIGDTPPPFIALGAHITLRRGNERREVKLKDFFIAYGKQDRQPGEFVESVTIPYLPAGEKFACYKVSKRKDEDISALCGAFRIFVNDDGVVGMVRIAFGGMAATPKRAKAVEEALLGKPWTAATVEAALPAFAADFQPLTDMRASKEYRMLAAQNLLRRFQLETTGAAERLSRAVA